MYVTVEYTQVFTLKSVRVTERGICQCPCADHQVWQGSRMKPEGMIGEVPSQWFT